MSPLASPPTQSHFPLANLDRFAETRDSCLLGSSIVPTALRIGPPQALHGSLLTTSPTCLLGLNTSAAKKLSPCPPGYPEWPAALHQLDTSQGSGCAGEIKNSPWSQEFLVQMGKTPVKGMDLQGRDSEEGGAKEPFFAPVLEIESRASCILNKCATVELHLNRTVWRALEDPQS